MCRYVRLPWMYCTYINLVSTPPWKVLLYFLHFGEKILSSVVSSFWKFFCVTFKTVLQRVCFVKREVYCHFHWCIRTGKEKVTWHTFIFFSPYVSIDFIQFPDLFLAKSHTIRRSCHWSSWGLSSIIPLRAKRVGEFIEIRHKKISPTRMLATLGCLSLCNLVANKK